jgi:diguanylate cyclase (GGDEF)-like protein
VIATLTSKGELVRVELRQPDGTIVAASEPGLAGTRVPPSAEFSSAVSDQRAQVSIVPAASSEAGPVAVPSDVVLREYLPLMQGGRVVLVVGVWRDAAPILGGLDDLRRDVVLVTLTAAILAAAVLFLVFRGAQGRLTRQTAALVAASQRDPLTGSLNHGALVGHLANEIERARDGALSLGVALIDVDNFRLLNDNHGHEGGDQALLGVSNLLTSALPDGIVMGRYGPDEFLLIAPHAMLDDLEPTVHRLCDALAGFSLVFDGFDPLPVTVSSGLCAYPVHGASVTLLLAAVARTLEEAKASGGNAIRVAGRDVDLSATPVSSFDVLQGLVFAVDTKDHYTKRHSEDVARYAMFLGERLGLDPAFLGILRTAGLLHDVGKIGIPDGILRKPSRLTAEEADIVKQHVALGDMVVHALPDLDHVRAGIRHHHERWDGRGYLAGLSGEEIPLIARILAVGDAFSAMTTSRPYRRALDVREALTRLADAAGSHLDERLVLAFITGIETAADPPLPGAGARATTLWTPRSAVA